MAAEPQIVEEMFVQVAKGSKSSDGALTLTGVSPSTLYFSDRPERVVGHMTNQQFVEGWSLGENSFASDPPNAVLSYVDPGDDRPEDCVVVLRDPKVDSDSIRYSIDLLEGSVPESSGACTLFIDPLGRPLSPVSVAGMRRRDRRR
ncbi:MAG: hypothetical protein ACLQRH_00540 [Acidimicrobiales bacterium]